MTVKSVHDRADFSLCQASDVSKGSASAEKVKCGGDKERKTGPQVGKLSDCKRGKGIFCDVGKGSAFEPKILTETKKSDALRRRESDAELVARKTCRSKNSNFVT